MASFQTANSIAIEQLPPVFFQLMASIATVCGFVFAVAKVLAANKMNPK